MRNPINKRPTTKVRTESYVPEMDVWLSGKNRCEVDKCKANASYILHLEDPAHPRNGESRQVCSKCKTRIIKHYPTHS